MQKHRKRSLLKISRAFLVSNNYWIQRKRASQFFDLPAFYLRYPHNALRFTNHVGEQRNFCKQKCDVPFLVCLSNSTLSAQRSAYFFKTLYGTTFPHTARLHKFMNNQTLPLRVGCRGCQPIHLDIFRYKVVNPTGERCSPLQIVPMVCCAAKSLRSLRILLWIRI